MEEQTFDLTVPVTRGFLLTQTAMGVLFVVLGFIYLENSTLLGTAQLVAGLLILTFVGLVPKMNKHIIAFRDANLEIEKGLFRHDDISWPSIAEIHVETKKVEFILNNEKSVAINFGGMSYSVNQTVKPEIIAAATAFAEAKGIEVKDSRAHG